MVVDLENDGPRKKNYMSTDNDKAFRYCITLVPESPAMMEYAVVLKARTKIETSQISSTETDCKRPVAFTSTTVGESSRTVPETLTIFCLDQS